MYILKTCTFNIIEKTMLRHRKLWGYGNRKMQCRHSCPLPCKNLGTGRMDVIDWMLILDYFILGKINREICGNGVISKKVLDFKRQLMGE